MDIHQRTLPSTARSRAAAAIVQFCSAGTVALGLSFPADATLFNLANLVTDDQTVNHAQITDPKLINAWGISHSASSPFWVSDNGTGFATLYSVNPVPNAVAKVGLEVAIPGAGTVTGQTFANIAGNFNGDTFLFVSEDGTISGWRNALGTTAEVLQIGSAANVYKGTALATVSGNTYLYATNFRAGTVDVIKSNAASPNLTGNFTDPNLPAGYAPFNIKLLNGNLFV